MRINYPIKYAVIPITEDVVNSYGAQERIFVCYIVSKCYLLEERKKYTIDGRTEKEYRIVIPYEKHDYNTWRRVEESCNLVGWDCVNSITTDAVYDTIAEARIAKERKNQKLLDSMFSCMPYDIFIKNSKQVRSNFKKKLNFYEKFEDEIERKTKELCINRLPKEQSVIVKRNNEREKIKKSLYYIISYNDDKNSIVYSVTEDEFNILQEIKNNIVPITKFNHTPLLIHNKESNISKLITPNNQELYLINQKLVEKIDEYFVEPRSYEYIIYTLEDYKDIIESYKNSDEKIIRLVRDKQQYN